MNLSRRGLLRALPALPLAGNEIKRRAAELAGVSTTSAGDMVSPGYGVPMHSENGMMRGSALARFLRSLGALPKWKRREIRSQARSRRILDPDIASLRSVSFSGAMQMQWRREEQRLTEDVISLHDYVGEREDWLKRNGVDWM